MFNSILLAFLSANYGSLVLAKNFATFGSTLTPSPNHQLLFTETCSNNNDFLQSDQIVEDLFCGIDIEGRNGSGTSINESWLSNDNCMVASATFAEYCVYAFPDRNLMLIVTPSTASSIVSSPGFYSSPANFPSSSSDSYSPLPGSSKNLIANTTFHRGEQIQISAPVLIVDEEIFETSTKEERRVVLEAAFRDLPSDAKRGFWELAGEDVEEKIRSNAFSATFPGEGGKLSVVILDAAELNHNCRPNARFAFDPETLTYKVHAIRTIKPGEDLTISYVDENLPFASRQALLQSQWGFTCACSRCSLPQRQQEVSDARIEAIHYLRAELLDFEPFLSRKYPATPEMALQLIELYHHEALDGVLAEAYTLAAYRFCMWEDEEQTRKFASKAVENWLVWEKQGLKEKNALTLVAQDPRGSWCWGSAGLKSDDPYFG